MQTETLNRPSLATGQTRDVLVWKFVEYAGLAVFAALVPRLMGPSLYGRFAGLLSLIGLLTVICGLGALPTFGRFVPEYQANGDQLKIRILFTQVFAVRLLVVLFLSAAFVLLFPRLLPQASTSTVLVGVGAFLIGAPALTFYQFFHGLNKLGQWLSQDALLKIILLLTLLGVGGIHSLDRAALALFMTQIIIFFLGLYWARSYFRFDRQILNLPFLYDHLRFGLLFFSANLLLMAIWRAGEIAVLAFSGKAAEVAFFNLANLITMTVATLISQLAIIITPSLSLLYVKGKNKQVDEWLGYSLKYLMITSFAFLIVVYALAPWGVQLVWGEDYLPVVENLKILAIGLLAVALIRTGISLAILKKEPGKVFQVTIGALVTFLIFSAILIPRFGSFGASGSVTLALWVSGLITYKTFYLGGVLSVAYFWRHSVFGLIAFVILALFNSHISLAGPVALALYIGLLFLGRVISIREIRHVVQVVVA